MLTYSVVILRMGDSESASSPGAFAEALLRRLDELKAEITLAQQDLEVRKVALEQKREQVESILTLLDAEGTHIERAGLHGILPVSIADVAAKVLREARGPLHYKELLERIGRDGFRVPGQNPSASLIALLHRKREVFARHGSGIWGLAEWGTAPKVVVKDARRRRRKVTSRSARKRRDR